MYSGDTLKLSLTITDESTGNAVNLTGAKVWMLAKWSYNDADAVAVINKYGTQGGVLNGVTFPAPASGQCEITLDPADTAINSDRRTELVYDIQLKESSGVVTTLLSGKLVILPEVTRSIT